MMHTKIVLLTSVFVVALALFAASSGQGAPITWNNGAATMRWNASEANFTGSAFTDGDGVTFGSTGAGSVYIGVDGPSPVNVAPASVAITGGTYTFSGGDITSGSVAKSGTGTTTFSGYTSSLTFGGGTTLAGGDAAWLAFNPASAGTYGFGSGTISLNGGSFKIGGPTTGTTTVTNNFTVGSSTSYLLWDGSGTARVLSGNFTLNGNGLTLGNAHPYTPGRQLQLTGTINLNGADRTISSWNETAIATVPCIMGDVNGGGTYSLTLGVDWGRGMFIGGNGGWNIKDLNVLANTLYVEAAANDTDFFSGVRANGGKVNVSNKAMYLRRGAFHFDDFTKTSAGLLEVHLNSGYNVKGLGGTIDHTTLPGGVRVYVAPGTAGTLSGDITVVSGGILENRFEGSLDVQTLTSRFGSGNLTFLGGSLFDIRVQNGNWGTQTRAYLQAQDDAAFLRFGDGLSGTAETVTFRGACNVPTGSGHTRGFIIRFNESQVVDDGNVVLRYDTPTANPWSGEYDSNDRLIIGWSDTASSAIQYPFRGGSAGTEFVPRVAQVAALGPTSGTVFTATNAVRLLATGLVGFYNTAAMDLGALGPVVVADGGSLLTVSNGTMSASTFTVNDGGALGGIGTFNTTAVTLNSGATVDVGNADLAGTLRLTNSAACNLAVNGAATLAIDVFGNGAVAGVDYDRLSVKSAVTGLSNLDLVVRFKQDKLDLADQTLTILTTSSDLTGQAFKSVTFENSYRGTVTYGNGFVSLSNVLQPPKGTTILVR